VSLVDWQIDGSVCTAVLNDPTRRNALSTKLRGELAERYEEFDARDDLRVLVLAGAGPAFCAGGDLAEMPTELGAARRFLGGGELAHARDGEAQLYLTANCREGIAAFHEKRKPTFRGH